MFEIFSLQFISWKRHEVIKIEAMWWEEAFPLNFLFAALFYPEK